jgi:hypothetical protein
MTDQNYEIDIEPGRDDEEMQLDTNNDNTSSHNVNRKGRGFGNNAGDAQLARNGSGRLASGNPAHATAVRCIPPPTRYSYELLCEEILMCSY